MRGRTESAQDRQRTPRRLIIRTCPHAAGAAEHAGPHRPGYPSMQWVLVGRMVDAGNPNVPPNKALRPTPRAASRPDDLDTGPIDSDRQPVRAANLGECDAHRGSARTTDCRRHTGRAIATPARGSDDNVQVQ